MDLSRFPRRRYTPYAAPVEPLPRLSAALAASCPGGRGPELRVKRDDMLGLFPGGNKTRKLEFLVTDALAQGVGGFWQPKYSIPNAAMVEAVPLAARTAGLLLDPVYTGKVMAGLIGLARRGEIGAGERAVPGDVVI